MSPNYSHFFGVDVAKASVVVHEHGQRQTQSLANNKQELEQWLSGLPEGSAVAAEATGKYHQLLVSLACSRGLTVFLLNPRDVKHYGQALGRRAKTDHLDAQLISRYVAQEHAELHPYELPTDTQARVTALLERRHAIVKARTALQQSFDGLEFTRLSSSLNELDALLDEVDETIFKIIAGDADMAALRDRLWTIVGFGPTLSAAMANLLSRFRFDNGDALIAYIGFDPRARESGAWRGKRKLSKRGPAEIRRLLYMGAMSAAQTETWKTFYQRHIQRGLSSTAAFVILGRKLARVAFSMAKYGTEFDREITRGLA